MNPAPGAMGGPDLRPGDVLSKPNPYLFPLAAATALLLILVALGCRSGSRDAGLGGAAPFAPDAASPASDPGVRSAAAGRARPSPWSGTFGMGPYLAVTLPRAASTLPGAGAAHGADALAAQASAGHLTGFSTATAGTIALHPNTLNVPAT